MGDLGNLAFGVAVHQQIGLGVQQHRAAHGFGPVIVVRDAPQAGLDAADHDRHVLIGLARALRVHDHGAVGTLAAFAAGRVGVVRADFSVGGIAVDHRIHVAGGDAEKKLRPTERLKCLGRAPVGLADDADAETLGLERASDERHAETRMVHVGIAGDENDVALVPTELLHLGARHRQHRRGAKAVRPVFAVRKNVACGFHGTKRAVTA